MEEELSREVTDHHLQSGCEGKFTNTGQRGNKSHLTNLVRSILQVGLDEKRGVTLIPI